jgi:hypothetical protein
VEYDEKFKEYFSTSDFESEINNKYFEEYDNETFWSELSEKLALKDLYTKYGEEKVSKMSQEEHADKLSELYNQYEEEFAKYGLENIEIKYLDKK